MKPLIRRAVAAVVVACALAFAISFLIVESAQSTPRQPNVPVFTYGSQ